MDKYDKLRAIVESIENDHPDVGVEIDHYESEWMGAASRNLATLDIYWDSEE